jgi:Ca-activated chloride channel family protein
MRYAGPRSRPLAAGFTAFAVVLGGSYLAVRPPPQPAVATGPVPCGVAITVAASLEKSAVLAGLADRYNGQHRDCGRNPTVEVSADGSGNVLTGLVQGWNPADHKGFGRPDVWSPASNVWVSMLAHAAPPGVSVVNESHGKAPSITKTPLVLAIPEPIADVLQQRTGRPVGWQTVFDLALEPGDWGRVKDPGWGEFKLGKTNPYYSTTGLASLVAAYATESGHRRATAVTTGDLGRYDVEAKVARIESAAIHYGQTSLDFLCNLARADAQQQALDYVTVVPVEEKSVYEYNTGQQSDNQGGRCPYQHVPTVRLKAVYPPEGTLMSDGPYAIMSTIGSADKRRVAADFLDFVRADAQQRTLQAVGFRQYRDDSLDPGVARAPGLAAHGSLVMVDPPGGDVLTAVRGSWDGVRKPARVLVLFDMSESMRQQLLSQQDAGPGEESRLSSAKAALTSALDPDLHLFGDQDEVALWPFNGDADTTVPDHPALGLTDLGAHRGEVTDAIARLAEPTGGTPLYATVTAAQRWLAAQADRAHINAILLLSDGADDYRGQPLGPVLDQIRADNSEHLTVRVFAVGYGQGGQGTQSAETLDGALRQICEASGGVRYRANDASVSTTDPRNIDRILQQVVSTF